MTQPSYDLRTAYAGYSILNELYRIQSVAEPVGSLAKLFGKSPIVKEAESWYAGYKGEQIVGTYLDTLKSAGYTVLHAVPVGKDGSDIDHVVITPSGFLYVINTKHHAGKVVKVYKNRIYVGGHKVDHLRNSIYESTRIAKRFSLPAEQVKSILAFVSPEKITFAPDAKELPLMCLEASKLVSTIQKEEKKRAALVANETINLPEIYVPETWADSWENLIEEQEARREWYSALYKADKSAKTNYVLWRLGALGAFLAIPLYVIPTFF